MRREITNSIRFVMDEVIPSAIRDNKYFMYPFYKIWFAGMDINKMMEFKADAKKMSRQEFADLYSLIGERHNKRQTDLNEACHRYITQKLDRSCRTLLDAGCGSGYFLGRLAGLGYDLTGCDLMTSKTKDFNFVMASIEDLPFRDKEFDIVVCNHTLEHVVDVQKAVSELKRITRKQLIITVPCQKYFKYTLDLHLHFFPQSAVLEDLVGIETHTCEKLDGDLVYIGVPR